MPQMSSRALSKSFLIVVNIFGVIFFGITELRNYGISGLPFEKDFAALSGDHDVEAFLEVVELKAVGDDGR